MLAVPSANSKLDFDNNIKTFLYSQNYVRIGIDMNNVQLISVYLSCKAINLHSYCDISVIKNIGKLCII